MGVELLGDVRLAAADEAEGAVDNRHTSADAHRREAATVPLDTK